MARSSTSPLKVAFVVPYFYPAHVFGGPIQSTYQLCRALSRAGCEIRVLTTDTNGDSRLDTPSNKEIELEDGVRVRYCHRSALESVSGELLIQLPDILKWADIIHLAPVYSFPTIPTLFLARILRKPLVWTPRGSLQRWEKTRKVRLKAVWEAICRALLPPYAVVHVTSEDEGRSSEARTGLPIRVISNGVDIPDHVTRIPSSGHLRLLYIGRLDPQKALENLLDAFSLASHRGLGLSLEIVGTGTPSYIAKLQRKTRELDIDGKIEMRGQLNGIDKERCFESADILVLPSFKENFGMAIAEALAHGMPVIASKGTPWEKVQTVGCGLWVDNHPESLANALCLMAHQPLEEMGKRGREWMMRDFSWELIAKQMIGLYEELAKD